MSNLTDIVPPLELCKLIPAGEFADSALVWRVPNCSFPLENEFYEIHERDKCESWMKDKQIPAPTLHEIMAELSLCDVYCDTGWFCMVGSPDHWSIGNCECDLYVKNGTENKSPEAAALKVWFKLKGN